MTQSDLSATEIHLARTCPRLLVSMHLPFFHFSKVLPSFVKGALVLASTLASVKVGAAEVVVLVGAWAVLKVGACAKVDLGCFSKCAHNNNCSGLLFWLFFGLCFGL